MRKGESTYNFILRNTFRIINPIKKSIIKTQCEVHKFINIYALKVLRNDKYTDQYKFFNGYVFQINEGVVWADQDFKSSSHFYSPTKKRGLYGNKSAMDLAIDYYEKSLDLWKNNDFNNSLFYLGAALHLIQDMTIPQHANIRLLDNHKQYETYIKRTYRYVEDFHVENGARLLDSIEDYIRFNTRVAIRIYNRFSKIKNDEERYYRISKCGLPLAIRTTAGAMVMFYNHIHKMWSLKTLLKEDLCLY